MFRTVSAVILAILLMSFNLSAARAEGASGVETMPANEGLSFPRSMRRGIPIWSLRMEAKILDSSTDDQGQ